MKSNVTSDKATGATVTKKKAAAPATKAVAASETKAPAKAKAAGSKTSVQPESVSILPEHIETKAPVTLGPETIALRAYLLWEASGYAHGRHEEHWLAAEKQLKNELTN